MTASPLPPPFAIARPPTLAQRRWQQFRAHRLGFFSLQLFLLLFAVSLMAEFIANDRPLLIRYDDQWFVPVLVEYAETDFGGVFPSPADYRDPFLADLITERGWMLWPPIPFSYDTVDRELPTPAPAPPSWRHPLGSDDQGRSVLARLIYGFRLSVLFGLLLTLTSTVIGVAVGAVQGYFGGWLDLVGQRFIEIWSGLPQLFILIIVASVLVPGFWTLLTVMLLFSWTGLVAVVRAEFLRGREQDYVRAARALGVSNTAVMARHILPNALVATLTFLPFVTAGAVTALTALDFLGLGLPPGSASLGDLLRQGKENLHAPWLGISGFVVIALLLTLLVMIGEAVRDAFDPRHINPRA